MAERIRVSREEYDREVKLIESLRSELASLSAEAVRLRPELGRRVARLESRLGQLATGIAVFEEGARDFEARIERRGRTIEGFERRVAELEAPARVSPAEAYYRRGVARDLRASIRTYRKWQTQDRESRDIDLRMAERLRRNRTRAEADLASVQATLEAVSTRIREVEVRLRDEEERLKRKEILVIARRIVQTKIVLIVEVAGTKHGSPYEKRFQGIYLCDAVEDMTTGEISLDDPLTQKEIEQAEIDFCARWAWAVPPADIELAQSGEVTVIPEPEGLFLVHLSVIEEGGATWEQTFSPPALVYSPSPAEREDMKKRVQA